MKHWKQRLHFYIATLAIMGAVSCTNEEVQIDSPTSPDVNTDMVKLTMKVSVPSSPGMTRAAMSTDTENELSTVKILAFKVVDKKNKEVSTYSYQTDGYVSKNSITGDVTIQSEVKKSTSDDDLYCFLLIANPTPNPPFPSFVNEYLSEVRRLISYECPDKWDVTKAIPMSGETGIVKVVDGTEFGIIQLTRAMARVDVGVNFNIVDNVAQETATGLTPDVFRLKSVSVYRSNTEGFIVKGVKASQRETPLIYTEDDITEARSLVRHIYLPESDAGDLETATCLIIGGRYSNAPNTNWGNIPTTYYRVDFMEGEAHTPIERNHRYAVNITSVKGAGHGTEEEALENRPINMGVEITKWDQSLKNIVVNGSDHFLFETKEINLGFYKDSDVTIKAESSVPVADWIIETGTWGDKIEVTTKESADPKKAEITFKALVDGSSNTTAQKVVMKMSNIKVEFTVTQETYVYGQPNEVVGDGWKPSDKEEDILTKPDENNI